MSDSGIGTIVFEWRDGPRELTASMTAEASTSDLVEAFYWFLLGCGHDPRNAAVVMMDVGEEHGGAEHE